MPELPEVAAHAERLHAGWAGATLTAVDVLSFTVLKTADPPADAGVGRSVAAVDRRGKHLLLRLDGEPPITYVVHMMQGGRLRTDTKLSKRPRDGLLRWRFDTADAMLLTEAGTERRAGVWVLRGDPATQAPLDELGPDAFALDADALAARLARGGAGTGGGSRLHTVLRDQRVLAGLGRRLANEVCHAARRSPFQPVGNLSAADVAEIAAALHDVLARELDDERAAGEMRRGADRATRVHRRTGQPCPACGDEVREVAYRDYTIHYCAACQTGGKVLADNTTSKFLR